MKLEPLTENTYVIETPFATVTLYRMEGGSAVLIDSGDYPRQELLELLKSEGLRVRAVICTHLHPDHISNNPALMARDGAEIFAPQAELGPSKQMYDMMERSGRYPEWAAIRPCYSITPITEAQSQVEIDGVRFPILQTPGHSFGHIAAATPDGVCALGDAMMSLPLIRRAKLPYMEDADQAIESMERIRQTDYPFYVTAHKGVTSQAQLPATVDENVRIELALYERFLRVIHRPRGREEAVDAFLEAAGVAPRQISWFVRHSAETRLISLVRAGELRLEDGMVFPVP